MKFQHPAGHADGECDFRGQIIRVRQGRPCRTFLFPRPSWGCKPPMNCIASIRRRLPGLCSGCRMLIGRLRVPVQKLAGDPRKRPKMRVPVLNLDRDPHWLRSPTYFPAYRSAVLCPSAASCSIFGTLSQKSKPLRCFWGDLLVVRRMLTSMLLGRRGFRRDAEIVDY